jgi:hypothetical protein
MKFVKNGNKMRKSGCRRNRSRQNGGSGGFAYSLGPAISPNTPYAAEIIRGPSCGNVDRSVPVVPNQGLPGMSGGRYTTAFEVYGPNAINVQVPLPCDKPRIGGRKTRRVRRGGAEQQFYVAPRAGYTHMPSNMAGGEGGGLADGKTPFLLNVPYSSAPVKSIGGSRRKSKSKKSKKTKKSKSKKTRKN